MKPTALLLVVLAAACTPRERDAYAVGAYVGTGSVFGPGPKCTHVVTPASSADIHTDGSIGKLLGPGQLVVSCESGYSETFDIAAPTSAKITGDESTIPVGAAGNYAAYPYDGKRELKTDGHFDVAWTFGTDCAASTTTDIDTPNGGHGLGGSYHVTVTGRAPGTCTLTAEVLGQTTTRTITIR